MHSTVVSICIAGCQVNLPDAELMTLNATAHPPSVEIADMESPDTLTCQICGRSGAVVALCMACGAIALCQKRHKKLSHRHQHGGECVRMRGQMQQRVNLKTPFPAALEEPEVRRKYCEVAPLSSTAASSLMAGLQAPSLKPRDIVQTPECPTLSTLYRCAMPDLRAQARLGQLCVRLTYSLDHNSSLSQPALPGLTP